MKYMKLNTSERKDLMSDLAEMPLFLINHFSGLDKDKATQRSLAGGFSPVEQVWHLADLEKEGFTVRLTQLLKSHYPTLLDFAGGQIAKDRNYRSLNLYEGLKAFSSARQHNLCLIEQIRGTQWEREGHLEGVGSITLCDMPEMLFQHDSEHKKEIVAWIDERISST